MNRCTFGFHKWFEKITYKSEPDPIVGTYLYFKGDVCEICGKHKYNIKKTYGMSKVEYGNGVEV